MDQLLLNIHPPAEKTLDNFVVGDNQECVEALNNFINSDNNQFIYLWGESGSGKSHLSEALSSQKITIIEDVDTFNEELQIETFYLFNQHKAVGEKMLLTGSNAPAHMGLREDLSSRLSWGLVYQLKILTDTEKLLALEHHANEKGMSLNLNVLAYCMKHLKRDLPSLISTLDALDEWSLKTKKPITIPLLKQLID
ncbi:MAG: DnaA/Hda family protein [Methylophilaceae bacterium]|mgnify:CR=1 FL=1|jgi:DnaA-homolog protein|nr:DnaA/Hda family protein [Methylophilaceae bacterium]